MGLLRRKRKRGSSKEEATTRRQSVEKRLRHQRKEKAGASQKAEAARRAAKDVYSLIGFDALYSDGIAQVEPGLFSQKDFLDVLVSAIDTYSVEIAIGLV